MLFSLNNEFTLIVYVYNRGLHTKKVGGYFVTDILENDFSRILLYFGVKKKI